MRKKIAMYFNLEKDSNDPLDFFGAKKEVYQYFFEYGRSQNLDMFIAAGKDNYLGQMNFKNLLFFDGDIFSKKNESILIDAIYDRSGGIGFPPEGISYKTLNTRDFKILCYDKNMMYDYFGEFMPKSFRINNKKDFFEKLSLFKKNEMVVLKPTSGLGGKGIFIDSPSNLKKIDDGIFKKEHVLQEFVDTSCGIPGITSGRHDFRVVIVGGEIVLAHVRTPKEGSLLANASQGGTIKEVLLNKIPEKILEVVEKVQDKIDKKFNFPVYSIDFGVSCKGDPYIFELNDQIGFPAPKMKNSKFFIENLIKSLKKLSERNN
jgi:hypothetical protein